MNGTPTLIKSFDAGAAVTPRRIVKCGATDHAVIQAAAATDAMFGVADAMGADSGQRCDVQLSGVVEIDFGGTVTRGGLVTADSDGKAVAAAPATGANARVIGIALVSAVDGDIGTILMNPHQIQGGS